MRRSFLLALRGAKPAAESFSYVWPVACIFPAHFARESSKGVIIPVACIFQP